MILHALVPFGCILMASYIGSMRWLKVNIEKPACARLGLKVLHISDFHSTSAKKTNSRIWERLHSLEFDIAVITGDLLQRDISELEPLRKHLQRLCTYAPVYFVDGNHEKFFYTELFKELEGLGVTILDNRCLAVNIKGRTLNIIGLSDFNRLKNDSFSALPNVFAGAQDRFMLVLNHQPQIIHHITEYSPDLLLCGHTHGGQVRIPFLPALYAPGQGLFPKYDHGWYKEKNTEMFISKGIGATYFNIRMFNRPEVAIIDI